MLRSLALAAVAFSASPAHANEVFYVQSSGPLTSVEPAIAAAADGDVILIRGEPGQSMGTVVIDGRSLTVSKDQNDTVPIVTSITVRHLAAHQKVVIRGVAGPSVAFLPPNMVRVENCAGPVVFEECTFAPSAALPGGAPVVEIVQSSAVSFTRCRIAGAPGVNSTTSSADPGAAVVTHGGVLALYDTRLTGGNGDHAFHDLFLLDHHYPQPGGPALVALGGTVLVAGETIRGGRGGNGGVVTGVCQNPGDGGAGILSDAALRRLDAFVAGGMPGSSGGGCTGAALPGADLVLGPSGTVATINDTLRRFEVSSPTLEGQVISNTITGQPGELAVMLLSFSPANLHAPSLKGVLLGGAPYQAFVLGTLPPTGMLQFDVPIAPGLLPAGIEALDLYEQILVGGATGTGILSTPCALLIVDDDAL